jgi:hypothetical protein
MQTIVPLGVVPSAEEAVVGSTERGNARENDGLRKNGLVELARYVVRSGERVLYAQRIGDILRITDCPAEGSEPSYLVERAIKRDAYAALDALLADYVSEARRHDEIPMVVSSEQRVQQVQLARYTLTGGERVLCGHRVDGIVCITDRPAAGSGRAYLVEHGIQEDGFEALAALVADYTKLATKLDEVPMAVSSVRCAVMTERSRRSLVRNTSEERRRALDRSPRGDANRPNTIPRVAASPRRHELLGHGRRLTGRTEVRAGIG